MGAERGVRRCARNNSADTKVSEEGEGGGAPDARAESFPSQLVEQTMVRQAVPLQSLVAQWSRYPSVAHERDLTLEQVDA